MTEQPSSPFDISPMWKMYMEPIELWKKNYETFLNSTPSAAAGESTGGKADSDSAASFFDGALWHWQKSGEELFKSFVQNQIELCEFLRDRWAQYLKLPEQLTQCRSLTELGKLQSAFLHEFASDYMQEMEKRAQPVAELARHAAQVVSVHR